MKIILTEKLFIIATVLAGITAAFLIEAHQADAAWQRAKPRMATGLYPAAFVTRQNAVWLAVLPKPGATEGDMIPDRPQDFKILSRLQPYTTRLRDGTWLITFQPATP